MVEEGIVSQLRGNFILVNITRKAACASCRLCRKGEKRLMQLELENSVRARVGEKVLLHLDDGIVLKGAFYIYIVPLIFLLIGLFCGNFLATLLNLTKFQELVSVAFGIIFMFLSFVVVRHHGLMNKEKFKPQITLVK